MAFRPIMMKDVFLRLGDESTGKTFQCQASSVTLTPKASVQRTKTLCPDGQFSDVDDPEWELEIGYLYGENTDGGTPATILAEYLFENHGTKADWLFRPRNGGAGYSGTLTLIAGPVGGKQGAWSEGSVTLPVEGQPVLESAGSGEGA